MRKQHYITPEVLVSTILHPSSVLCVSMQYDPDGGDPVYSV